MKVTFVASLEQALKDLSGDCDMGNGVTRPKCPAKSTQIRVLESIDGKVFVVEMCAEHDRELMRMLAAAPGGIRYQEEGIPIAEIEARLAEYRKKGDA